MKVSTLFLAEPVKAPALSVKIMAPDTVELSWEKLSLQHLRGRRVTQHMMLYRRIYDADDVDDTFLPDVDHHLQQEGADRGASCYLTNYFPFIDNASLSSSIPPFLLQYFLSSSIPPFLRQYIPSSSTFPIQSAQMFVYACIIIYRFLKFADKEVNVDNSHPTFRRAV